MHGVDRQSWVSEMTDLTCNITLTDAKVFWNRDYFAEKEIVCDPDAPERWVDVTWSLPL